MTNLYQRSRISRAVSSTVLIVMLAGLLMPESHASENIQSIPQPFDLLSPAFEPAAAPCSLYNNNKTAFGYLSSTRPGDRFASYLNPANCGGTEDFPMAIYWVSLPLYHFEGARWPVGVNVQIYQKLGLDSCGGPGELLYSYSCLLDSSTFAAPHVGVITLPDPVCVNGPIFVSFEYDGSTPQPYPSVLFDTQVPADPCLNWAYREGWVPWNVFWTAPGAGNFMIWVDGYSNSDFCATDEPETRSMASLYGHWPALVGTRVTTLGYYTDSGDAKLVDSYADYLANRPIPSRSSIMLAGLLADASYQADLCQVTGYLLAETNPTPFYPDDTVILALYPSKWTRLIDAPAYPGTVWDTVPDYPLDPDTNRGYFALMMGGGVDQANDHARYWRDLVRQFNFTMRHGQALAENAIVLYRDGIGRNTNEIPQARIDSFTVMEMQAAFGKLSQGIATQMRSGNHTQAHLWIGGQGNEHGVLTLGGQPISASELRSGVQSLLDSGCQEIFVTFSGAYEGLMAESLKALVEPGSLYIHVGSAAGDSISYSSPIHSPYFCARIDSLNSGQWYGGVLASSGLTYALFLDSLSQAWSQGLESSRAWLTANPPGSVSDSVRTKVISDSLALTWHRARVATVLSTTSQRARSWLRQQHSVYGVWLPVDVPPSGQVALTFSGDTLYSGDVTVYKDTLVNAEWRRLKAAVWKSNIPGCQGFQLGNERRVINADNTSITTFLVRNDSRRFRITADILTDQPHGESGSNPYQGAGFSLGACDQSSGEFETKPFPGHHYVYSPELPGVFTDTFPKGLPGPEIYVYYDILSQNQFWTDMEFWISISSVTTPGPLNMSVTGADVGAFAMSIDSPGIYTFQVGSISGIGQHLVGFWPTTGRYQFDTWALRSRISDPPTCCIGTTGNVNESGIVDLSDLSMLVSYLTGAFMSLPCMAEANVNGLGIVDLTDLSILVSYITGGGAVLPSCP